MLLSQDSVEVSRGQVQTFTKMLNKLKETVSREDQHEAADGECVICFTAAYQFSLVSE